MGSTRIDWGKIVTNAISTLVAALVVGAAAIIWNGVSTVGSRIQAAEDRVAASVDILSESIFDLQDEIDMLREEIMIYRTEYAHPDDNVSMEIEVPNRGNRDTRQEALYDDIKTKARTYK
jgi:hypothetical protein